MSLLFFLQKIYLMEKNKESDEDSLQKHEVHQHTETVINENNDTIRYLLEIKQGEECPVCRRIIEL
jgi:hypothetical protein